MDTTQNTTGLVDRFESGVSNHAQTSEQVAIRQDFEPQFERNVSRSHLGLQGRPLFRLRILDARKGTTSVRPFQELFAQF